MCTCIVCAFNTALVTDTKNSKQMRDPYMNKALCLMKRSMAERLPKAWFVAMKKNTPILKNAQVQVYMYKVH